MLASRQKIKAAPVDKHHSFKCDFFTQTFLAITIVISGERKKFFSDSSSSFEVPKKKWALLQWTVFNGVPEQLNKGKRTSLETRRSS